MKLSKFLYKKINFVDLEELNSIDKTNIILILDSSLFKIFTFVLDKNIDAREKEFEINDFLEEKIENYDPFNYIEKKIILSESDENIIFLIILLEKEKISSLIENSKNKKIELIGIYPLFLMEFFNKEEKFKTYLEIENTFYRLYFFNNFKLINFEEHEFDKDELLDNKELILENNNLQNIFIYENQNYLDNYFENLEIKNWKSYSLKYCEELNFIPEDIQEKIKYQKIFKLFFPYYLVLVILLVIISFLINFNTEEKINKIINLEKELGELKENVFLKKEEIIELENKIDLLEKEKLFYSNNPIKVSKLMKIIDEINNFGLEIHSLEFNNNFLILGKTQNEKNIYEFEKKLLESTLFKNLNHDYIKYNNNEYEFLLEFEVNYEKF